MFTFQVCLLLFFFIYCRIMGSHLLCSSFNAVLSGLLCSTTSGTVPHREPNILIILEKRWYIKYCFNSPNKMNGIYFFFFLLVFRIKRTEKAPVFFAEENCLSGILHSWQNAVVTKCLDLLDYAVVISLPSCSNMLFQLLPVEFHLLMWNFS